MLIYRESAVAHEFTSHSSFRIEKLEPFIRDESHANFSWVNLSDWPGEVNQVSLRSLCDLICSSSRVVGSRGLRETLSGQAGAN